MVEREALLQNNHVVVLEVVQLKVSIISSYQYILVHISNVGIIST